MRNIAEQISVIETKRDIDLITIQSYLPNRERNLPLVLDQKKSESDFSNEREILYKVLFDMKRDMTEMRQQLNGLLSSTTSPTHRSTDVVVNKHTEYVPVEEVQDEATQHIKAPLSTQDVEEAVLADEAPLSTMEDIERESIRRALERNKGSRKMAANELHISERTLYRKIKEYGL